MEQIAMYFFGYQCICKNKPAEDLLRGVKFNLCGNIGAFLPTSPAVCSCPD